MVRTHPVPYTLGPTKGESYRLGRHLIIEMDLSEIYKLLPKDSSLSGLNLPRFTPNGLEWDKQFKCDLYRFHDRNAIRISIPILGWTDKDAKEFTKLGKL